MITAWTKHLQSEEEKQRFISKILSSKEVLDRLNTLLIEEEKQLNVSETSIKDFDQPNWENRQAFKNGYRSCLGVLRRLVDLDQQKDKDGFI